jgi:hypothetical protein
MKSPQIHVQGYWLSKEEGHANCFDPALAEELALLLDGKSVCDFGCGLGKYVLSLRKAGLECDGYDGNPHTPVLTDGVCKTLNLAQPVQLEKQYDCVISLEVGEHVPKEYESTFLDNLSANATVTIVLSWAIPGQEGDGHVNCHANSYIIYQLWKRGFVFQPRWTALIRANASLYWFKNTLMVFCKGLIPLLSLPECRAMVKIIGADVERLKKNNRSNSSLVHALVGKSLRSLSPIKDRVTKAINFVRLLRYDVTKLCPTKQHIDSCELSNNVGYFFPVCFTCGKHFRFVRLALFSLGKCRPLIKEVSIYMDRGDPLSPAECKILKSECRYPLNFRVTRYPMSAWGPMVQLSELQAYQEIAEDMGDRDFLVKFDSDVLFLSDEIFRFVANNNAGVVGTPVSKLHDSARGEDYMQGGCYFVRSRELKAILGIPVRETSGRPTKWGELPEDQFFSELLRRCRVKFSYNDFLFFDPIFIASGTGKKELEDRLRAMPSNAGVLHFEGNQWDKVDRTNMRRTAEWFFGPLPPPSNPYQWGEE